VSFPNQSGNRGNNDSRNIVVLPESPQVVPPLLKPKATPLSPTGLSSWLLYAAAFLIIFMLALLGLALNNAPLLVVALLVAAITISVGLTLYFTSTAPGTAVSEQTPTVPYQAGQLALTSGLEGMSEGLLLTHMDGRLIYANKRTEEFLKWCRVYQEGQRINSVDEWLNKIRPAITNRDSFRMALTTARQYSGQGQVPSFEFSAEVPVETLKNDIVQPIRQAPFVNPGGEIGRDPAGELAGRPVRDMRLTLFPVDDASGRQVGTGYLLRDVTRDRELDRLKDQFVSMVSHELRNPISIILSMTEILGETSISQEERNKWVGQINNEALRLRAMLNDMLDISRLEEGKLELSVLPINLKSAIQQVVELFRLQQKTPHEIVIDLQTPTTRVMADVGKLNQVLTNLIGNALKYSPNGGKVTVTVSAPQQTEDDNDLNARLMLQVSVTDQGMGIPEREQAKIFSRFFRSSTSRRSPIGGTGLGLSITQRLVKMMGGNIWFTSKDGQGSTFYFTLPAAK